MLYREIIAVCSQIHTKHINTLCGKNVEFVNVKTLGTNGYHLAVNMYQFFQMFTCYSSKMVLQYIFPAVRL